MPENAALLTTLILERPLCAECIASKGGFTALDIEQGFNSVRGVLKLVETLDRCRACGELREVFSLARRGPE